MGKLEGKVAAVTGGGRGIGREVCKALAAQGAAVVVNDLGVSVAGQKETQSPADDVAKEIKASGGTAASNHDGHRDARRWRGSRQSGDQGIRQARYPRECRRHPARPHDFQHDRRGMGRRHPRPSCGAISARCARPRAHMRESKFGRIINFSSNSAQGSPGQPNYAAAKAGILGLTYSAANSLAKVWHHLQRDHARRRDSHDRYDPDRPDARCDRPRQRQRRGLADRSGQRRHSSFSWPATMPAR